MIQQVLHAMAEGRTLTVGTMPEALTTTVAAEHLGISRPTLMKLVRDGEIDSFKVGTHTRIRFAEIKRYRAARLERQRKAFDELRALEEAEGLD
ncbi:helix-turn-helix domain-containing protein [Litorihabitans aurantiacus]|uniref:helix-turn-helix domain-containing protein n=1 Tax=Litorihabitans aurantiacus TaxID=1930061 RepID=UPI0024E12355|nr:helix-turn-helix domain-containing protein [Litorihabitans aurantiacus]